MAGPEPLSIGGRSVSRETWERLAQLESLLGKWNRRINLVSPRTLPDFWTRHVLDSAQLFDLAPQGSGSWADLGSGGGFPGLVVAILAADERPDLRVTLVESDQRKAAFLMTAAREIVPAAGVRVLAARAESVPPLSADVVSARALAPLAALLPLAMRHLAPKGVALFPKGARWRDEVAAGLANWRFNIQNHPSRTDPEAVVLAIEGISRG